MSKPPKVFFSTSFVGDFSYQASTSQADKAHTLLTGRKTWKTSKGKNEAVWPAHVEAALFDALEKYRPAPSGKPRPLRRFPKRNRFISEHILKVTGKARTPKQVGSRLQQLRDTCQDEQVLKLLSRREFPLLEIQRSLSPNGSEVPLSPEVPFLSCSSTSTSRTSSPLTPQLLKFSHHNLDLSLPSAGTLPKQTVANAAPPSVLIDVNFLPQSELSLALQPLHEPLYLLEINFPTHGPYLCLENKQRSVRLVQPVSLNSITPAVKMLCEDVIPDAVHSIFQVFLDNKLIHSEATDVELLPGRDLNGKVQYSAKLIPQYWATLCKEHDRSRYTVTQEVMRIASIKAEQTVEEAVLFGVSYKFRGTPIPQPYPPIELPVPRLESGAPLYAPRPLRFATSSTLLGVSTQSCGRPTVPCPRTTS